MHTPSSSHRPVPFAAALVAAAAVLLGACSGGSEVAEGATDPEVKFCRLVEEYDAELKDSEDNAAVVAAVEQLAVDAPEEIAGSFEAIADAYQPLLDLEPDDPNGFGVFLGLLANPEFLVATKEADGYVSDNCDIELGWSESFSGSALGGSGGAQELRGKLELDDVSAVLDANAGSSWADKSQSRLISGGKDVEVGSVAEQGFTTEEAVQVCTVLLAELSKIEPAVTITVTVDTPDTGNVLDGRPIAESSGGTCAPV